MALPVTLKGCWGAAPQTPDGYRSTTASTHCQLWGTRKGRIDPGAIRHRTAVNGSAGAAEFRATQMGPLQLPGQGRTQQPSCSGLASPCMAAGGGEPRVGRDGKRTRGAAGSAPSPLLEINKIETKSE